MYSEQFEGYDLVERMEKMYKKVMFQFFKIQAFLDFPTKRVFFVKNIVFFPEYHLEEAAKCALQVARTKNWSKGDGHPKRSTP